MEPYKEMYLELYRQVTVAVERLQSVQQTCETMYCEAFRLENQGAEEENR